MSRALKSSQRGEQRDHEAKKVNAASPRTITCRTVTRPRRAETHLILAGVMMDVAILLPSSGAARAARLLKRAARV